MPRFYFNLVTGSGVVVDPEGTELATLDEARSEAIFDARTLMSEAVLRGRDISDQQIHICDDAGTLLAIVGFGDAIRRCE
ncbi:hypothetical protein N2599_23765 (plasmid) [Rhizobium sullae]|uniref:DUF6894 domain-containing protein n=1 Tax=Rhizobium sullae TaxID=50338 RepID=A0A2N0D823_RHISU|nr:hypothetical protein [Rhizobium sullae]PKA42221.1 hypothetical protein CWR43_19145 [Rhizobium sullae]UWU18272.1 hypothetical protein N2599_23765 [Rhizobium sullae]